MKAILLAGALLLAALTTKTHANDVTVIPVVLKTFQQSFIDAADVQWSQVEALYKADFTVDGEKMAAFFSNDGALLVTSRFLVPAQLPRVLQSSLKSYTASFTITEAFEVQDDAGTDYYAVVQKAGETLILKADGKKWSVYKKN